MEEQLQKIINRYNEIEHAMADPKTVSDQNVFKSLTKEHAKLAPIVQKYNEYIRVKKEIEETKIVLKSEKDQEMILLLEEEIFKLELKLHEIEQHITQMLLPQDPHEGKDIIIEIRAGTGGDEASLFVADLYRMYIRYADLKGWKIEYIDANQTELGGFKEVIFSISGSEAYSCLKFESGVHRVQRIPVTESGGRIHTSAVTVAVLPEAAESDVYINPDDIRIDVYRSSGHGGQSVNTTDSAVRVTHIPTGIIVTCQDEKSQHKNRAKALRVLRARLFEKMERERMEKEIALRRSQIGSGDRSERIRTYNFPQSRVTDHRINLTIYDLESVLDGELDKIIIPLRENEMEQLLKASHV
ncbi:MAG: peptide chain release factor 1 [Spirochaetota bacterium]